jgi:hypothetical protein
MEDSFGCAANRKSQRLISTPTYLHLVSPAATRGPLIASLQRGSRKLLVAHQVCETAATDNLRV